MSDLVLPIIVAEGLDISIFYSIDTALKSLEPWWVEEKLGNVYDAQGRLITLKAGDRQQVSILTWEVEPTHADELKSILSDFLKFANNSKGIDPSCDLPCLITECQKLMKIYFKLRMSTVIISVISVALLTSTTHRGQKVGKILALEKLF